MYFSRIKLRADIQKSSQLQRLLQANSYGIHQLLWDLFPDEEKRIFLFREEIAREQLREQRGVKGESIYYLLSKQLPSENTPLFDVESKLYDPVIKIGSHFTFKLRVNPVEHGKTARTDDEAKKWLDSRKKRGLPLKEVPKKRNRHDIIMAAKHRMEWQELSVNERPSLANLVQQEGESWLIKKGADCGFELGDFLRVDGYRWHGLPQKGTRAGFSSLDFEGVIQVIDCELFRNALFTGIGPAKGFGCGMMMIKRT